MPDWRQLTHSLWGKLLGAANVPAWLRDEREVLARVRERVGRREGAAFAERLGLLSPHPLADQFALEMVRVKCRDETAFVRELRRLLYPPAPRSIDANDTLGVLARILASEQRAARRRVVRIISFNADDHLETEANRGHGPRRDPVLWPIARESGHPRMARGANGRPPIPVYHVHGFLPRDGAARQWLDAPDTLVFTDAEYWATVASPLTFANRVMAQALHDSSCVFVGVSMLDVNLIRWLGTRYNAVRDDLASQSAFVRGRGRASLRKRSREALQRHFWIRDAGADPQALIGEVLLERGVRSIVLDHWGLPFARLMSRCFAPRPRGAATSEP